MVWFGNGYSVIHKKKKAKSGMIKNAVQIRILCIPLDHLKIYNLKVGPSANFCSSERQLYKHCFDLNFFNCRVIEAPPKKSVL